MNDLIERLRAIPAHKDADPGLSQLAASYLEAGRDVCAHMTQVVKSLEDELADLKARSCAGCKYWKSHGYGHCYGDCRHELVPVEGSESDFCCNKWEPKT